MESPLTLDFICLDDNPNLFFDFLPEDWSEDIAPVWNKYSSSSHIYALVSQKGKVLGGGIVFSTVSPDISYASDIAKSWLSKGYDYLAYLYIDETHRSKGLGRKWLKSVCLMNLTQKFWLTIDDYNLSTYYIKNGFALVDHLITSDGSTEWIMTYEPTSV